MDVHIVLSLAISSSLSCCGEQVAEETIANDEVVVIKGSQEGHAVSVLLRGANDYMLDEMDRSLHDSFCVIKRVLESGTVVPGPPPPPSLLGVLGTKRKSIQCKRTRDRRLNDKSSLCT